MDEDTARRWSEATILAIVVYVAIDVALVFLRPRFSVLHSAESDYGSEGPYAWVMDVNFVLRGLLSLTLVGALLLEIAPRTSLRLGAALLAVWATASALLAFFPDDPAGTPLDRAGRIHVALAVVAFVGVAGGTYAAGAALRRDPRFAPLRRLLPALSTLALLAALALGRARLRPHSLGGLYEKLFLACELAWMLVVAVWLKRGAPPQPLPSPASG